MKKNATSDTEVKGDSGVVTSVWLATAISKLHASSTTPIFSIEIRNKDSNASYRNTQASYFKVNL